MINNPLFCIIHWNFSMVTTNLFPFTCDGQKWPSSRCCDGYGYAWCPDLMSRMMCTVCRDILWYFSFCELSTLIIGCIIVFDIPPIPIGSNIVSAPWQDVLNRSLDPRHANRFANLFLTGNFQVVSILTIPSRSTYTNSILYRIFKLSRHFCIVHIISVSIKINNIACLTIFARRLCTTRRIYLISHTEFLSILS